MTTPASGGEADLTVKLVPAVLPEIPPPTHPTFPELQQPVAQPQGILSSKVSVQNTYY